MIHTFSFLAANNDWVGAVLNGVQDAVGAKASIFVQSGLTLAKAIAVITMVLFGITTAFRGLDMDSFVSRVLLISTVFAMLRGYNVPVVGLNQTFPQLIESGPNYYAQQIGLQNYKNLDDKLNDLIKNNPEPFGFLGINHLTYYLVRLLIELTRFSMLFVVSYGFAAQGVCVILGPIFIPFLLLEPLQWMFWGWLKCFMQYSFYPLVAATVVLILSNALLYLWPMIAIGFNFGIVPYLLCMIVGVLSVPSLVSHLFSGSSSLGGGSMLGRVATMAAGKAL